VDHNAMPALLNLLLKNKGSCLGLTLHARPQAVALLGWPWVWLTKPNNGRHFSVFILPLFFLVFFIKIIHYLCIFFQINFGFMFY
jgi:hypothetical protein